MTEAPPSPPDALAVLQPTQAAEAAQLDPVGWHYILVLAERTRKQSGLAQALLQAKLNTAVAQLHDRLAKPQTPNTLSSCPTPSPLSALLQEMAAPSAQRPLSPSDLGRLDNPRVEQFRQQLGKINVQKQVTQAIAQAPQNAGPINSHMLVLRSLGLMRDISPDYLNRFVGYVDTLLILDSSQLVKTTPKKVVPASKSER
ncbi:MAG: hypothetical protein RJB14_1420 [Pseudomonadota bacterium]